MEGMLFRNMGKEDGEVAGGHCNRSSFILMLVCLKRISRPKHTRLEFDLKKQKVPNVL